MANKKKKNDTPLSTYTSSRGEGTSDLILIYPKHRDHRFAKVCFGNFRNKDKISFNSNLGEEKLEIIWFLREQKDTDGIYWLLEG